MNTNAEASKKAAKNFYDALVFVIPEDEEEETLYDDTGIQAIIDYRWESIVPKMKFWLVYPYISYQICFLLFVFFSEEIPAWILFPILLGHSIYFLCIEYW